MTFKERHLKLQRDATKAILDIWLSNDATIKSINPPIFVYLSGGEVLTLDTHLAPGILSKSNTKREVNINRLTIDSLCEVADLLTKEN